MWNSRYVTKIYFTHKGKPLVCLGIMDAFDTDKNLQIISALLNFYNKEKEYLEKNLYSKERLIYWILHSFPEEIIPNLTQQQYHYGMNKFIVECPSHQVYIAGLNDVISDIEIALDKKTIDIAEILGLEDVGLYLQRHKNITFDQLIKLPFSLVNIPFHKFSDVTAFFNMMDAIGASNSVFFEPWLGWCVVKRKVK